MVTISDFVDGPSDGLGMMLLWQVVDRLLRLLLAFTPVAPEDGQHPANVDPPAAPFVFEDEQRPLVAVIGFAHWVPLPKVYDRDIMHPERAGKTEARQRVW
jgi:hypothetical protein